MKFLTNYYFWLINTSFCIITKKYIILILYIDDLLLVKAFKSDI